MLEPEEKVPGMKGLVETMPDVTRDAAMMIRLVWTTNESTNTTRRREDAWLCRPVGKRCRMLKKRVPMQKEPMAMKDLMYCWLWADCGRPPRPSAANMVLP